MRFDEDEFRYYTGMQDPGSRAGNPDTAGRDADKRQNDDGLRLSEKQVGIMECRYLVKPMRNE